MKTGAATRWVLISILLSGIFGCALFDPPLDVRAIQSPAGPVLAPDDALYQAAVRAIVTRNYGLALDYLQAARQKQRTDVRVLNAFGVVYDKLGRFDLSARYYAEAKKLDPASAIVTSNLAYSARLQGNTELPLAGSEAVATLPTLPRMTGALAPGSVSIGQPANPAVPLPPTEPLVAIPGASAPEEPLTSGSPEPAELARPVGAVLSGKPLLTGAPLMIVNASGLPGASEPVRQHLVSKGWTAPRSAMSDGASQPDTTIRFAASNAVVASGLARTLSFPSRLLRCEGQCRGLRLTLGRDFLAVRAAKPASVPVKPG